MGGTELVASVSLTQMPEKMQHSPLSSHELIHITQLFAECHANSSSPLCVEHPHEIAQVIWAVGSALVVKGCLTIITFGIKLPGERPLNELLGL